MGMVALPVLSDKIGVLLMALSCPPYPSFPPLLSRLPCPPGTRRAGARCPALVLPLLLLIVFSLVLPLVLPLPAHAQVPPDAEWRTVRTEHFRITYHTGLQALAGRAAERAERAYGALSDHFIEPPSGRIDLLLTDKSDVSNGLANVYPSNRITIFARPPVDGVALAWFDDWMELVVTHELAHIFHLDRAGVPGRIARTLFGRMSGSWPFFPGRSVPSWTTEGIATFYESALSDAGRTHGSYHEMVVRTAILAGTFESIDEASGSAPVWPAGGRAYVYGSLFFAHLLNRHGEERMADFVDAVAGQWVPFRLDSAARSAFGISFSDAWEAWEDELEARFTADAEALAARAPLTRSDRLVAASRVTPHPLVSPAGDQLAYVHQGTNSDVELRVVALESHAFEDRVLTRLNGGATLAWEPDGNLVVSQLEWDGPHRLWSDLYRVTPEGRTTRLTRGSRLSHPAVHPGGAFAVAVQDDAGTNRLVEVDLATGQVRLFGPSGEARANEHWSAPRWSPDGRWLAVSRWRPGAMHQVVVMRGEGRGEGPPEDRGEDVDSEGRGDFADATIHAVTDDRAVDASPHWSPDGRWLLWSSDRTGVSNLFAAAIDPESGRPGAIRQVTNVLGGAFAPTIDPDGRWIFFTSYGAQGWEVERMAYDPEAWFTPFATQPRFRSGGERAAARYGDRIDAPSTRYAPWRTLLPRAWEPVYRQGQDLFGAEVVSSRFGARVEGIDLVGRHAYLVEGAYAPTSEVWDGRAIYAWSGLGNPVLSMALDQRYWSGGAVLGAEGPAGQDTLLLRVRDRSAAASMDLVRQRVRSRIVLTLSARHIWQDIHLLRRDLQPSAEALERPRRRSGEGAVTVSFNNARARPYGISPEDGVSGFVRARAQRELNLPSQFAGERGTDRAFDEVTGTLRAYRSWSGPGFANHVLGVRATAGAARGPGANAFHFGVGGASGQPETVTGFELFGGTSLLFPIRGYAPGARTGRLAWSGSAEYRFPLALVHRGVGLLPVYIDRLSGNLFLDGGNAWGPLDAPGDFASSRRASLASAGAEIVVTALPFWTSPIHLRAGVAFPFVDGNGATFHLRVGRAF